MKVLAGLPGQIKLLAEKQFELFRIELALVQSNDIIAVG
ncbi:uncharacterized protein BCN122_III0374 [Burkholderia cenocepacia]|nr:uncharacterized protein BCN122_III0374 [Burkholderia cenocepacia]